MSNTGSNNNLAKTKSTLVPLKQVGSTSGNNKLNGIINNKDASIPSTPSPRPASSSALKQSLSTLSSLSKPKTPLPASNTNTNTSKTPIKAPLTAINQSTKAVPFKSVQQPVGSTGLVATRSLSRIKPVEAAPLSLPVPIAFNESEPTPLGLSNLNVNEVPLEQEQLEPENEAPVVSSEETLIQSEYLPGEKVLIKCGGDVMCRYIKAVNKHGHTVYVELDTDGHVVVDPNMTILNKIDNDTMIPRSIKIGSYECAKNEACSGVIFECVNGICAVTNGPNMTPDENIYMKEGTNENTNDLAVAYPVVRMSELKYGDLNIINKSIGETHSKLRNVALNSCDENVSGLRDSIDKLKVGIDQFVIYRKQVVETLASTIRYLDNVNSQYGNNGEIMNADDQANIRTIRFNLRKRHNLVLELVRLSETLCARKFQVDNLLQDVTELNQEASRLFTGIGGVMEE
jgi:hypothetical protein